MSTLTEKRRAIVALFIMLLCLPVYAADKDDESEQGAERTFDNLVEVENSSVAEAFIDPDADFSVFTRVAVLEPHVAFRTNWQRDQNRSRSGRVTVRDMERIKSDVATLFARVFTDRLESAGYEVVEVAADDVLVVRPAIIDLDITAPDTRTPGRSRSFTTTSGAATLYIQLFDSVSGEILGRAVDRRTARAPSGVVQWSTSVSNQADARRIFGRWADKLIDFLDRHHGEKA